MKKYQSRRTLKKRIERLENEATVKKSISYADALVNNIVDSSYRSEIKALRKQVAELELQVKAHEKLNGKITAFEKTLAKKPKEKDYYNKVVKKSQERSPFRCNIDNCALCSR